MTDYTRLTVIGARRKAELVVPSDVALATLIPRLMELLEEGTASVARPLTLLRPTGEQLDLAMSAGDQGLDDGELLRLIRQDEAPPPPEIADVTDVLAEEHSARRGQWSPVTRSVTGAIAVGGFSTLAGLALLREPSARPEVILPIAYAAAVAIAVVAGRVGGRWVAIVATALAAGLVPAGAVALTSTLPEVPRLAVALGGGSAAVWLALGAGVGVGLGRRPALWGGILGVLLGLLPAGLSFLAWPVAGVLGVTGIAATIACGVLPWYAMSASGLTGLDDEVVDGRPRRRDEVLVTVSAAYRTLSWSVVAVAAPIAVTSALLLISTDPWAVGLGAALVVVAALRTRSLAMAVQAMALWAAALTAAAVGILFTPLLTEGGRTLVLLVLAIGGAVAAGVRPAAHQQASLRRLGNALETLAVVAAFPLLIGAFGIYAELLETV